MVIKTNEITGQHPKNSKNNLPNGYFKNEITGQHPKNSKNNLPNGY
jgi:hypothetical protein